MEAGNEEKVEIGGFCELVEEEKGEKVPFRVFGCSNLVIWEFIGSFTSVAVNTNMTDIHCF